MPSVDKYIKLIYIFAALFITAYISKLFVSTGMESWYMFSYKPEITPADSVFPIAWGILYILLGLSLFFATFDSSFAEVHKYNNEFVLQLVLQILWCWAFFYNGALMWGFIILLIMDFTAFRMIRIFNENSRIAAFLLYPYLAWLLYATLLNLNFVTELGTSVNI